MSARGAFPHTRMRRLRASAFARDMVRESTLSPADFIYPVFVLEGSGQREAVPSMPGVERLSVDLLVDCLLYTSPSPRDRSLSRMPSSA